MHNDRRIGNEVHENGMFVLTLWLLTPLAVAFLPGRAFNTHVSGRAIPTRLQLIPLTEYQSETSYFGLPSSERLCIDRKGHYNDGGSSWELSLVEESDLVDLCHFQILSFGADAVRWNYGMDAEDWTTSSAMALLNSPCTSARAFAEIYSALKSRISGRVENMGISPPLIKGLDRAEQVDKAEEESLVLVLAKRGNQHEPSTEIIASVELRLQATVPLSILSKIAAAMGTSNINGAPLQPYVSDLCVHEGFRGNQIGKALIRCVECIVRDSWGYNRIYLHVDKENGPAHSLYHVEGYREVSGRWNPFTASDDRGIAYMRKKLG